MRSRLALLLGIVAAMGAVLAVDGALRRAPQPRTWLRSPPAPAPATPAGWDGPARDSLGLVRRTTAHEARQSLAALSSCEAHAAHRTSARRNGAYRRCATGPLARTQAFAAANSRLLSGLAGASHPVRACRGRVLELSGTANTLAFVTRSTLRGGLGAPWPELRDASRSIRALAAETLRLARRPGWSAACRARRTPAATA